MKKIFEYVKQIFLIALGCSLFGLGFNLFLFPGGMNIGGLSGLAMIISKLLGFGSVGIITAAINLPLFILAGVKAGKKFFFRSLLGMFFLSIFIDLFSGLPVPQTEPVISAVYGGVMCGVGAGTVFTLGATTGGSDIVIWLLKRRWRNVPIGMITTCFDLIIAALTGIVFQDVGSALCSGIAIFITGRVVDAVVYRFDYSKVALIITKEYDAVAAAIGTKLDKGSTLLHGEGAYMHRQTKVVLTAIKRQQLAQLKQLVVDIDPHAFIIVQEAHQVLGDGFARYSKDSL